MKWTPGCNVGNFQPALSLSWPVVLASTRHSGSHLLVNTLLGKMHQFAHEQKAEQAGRVGSLEDDVSQVSSEAIQL